VPVIPVTVPPMVKGPVPEPEPEPEPGLELFGRPLQEARRKEAVKRDAKKKDLMAVFISDRLLLLLRRL